MQDRNRERLLDILTAAKRAQQLVLGLERDNLGEDDVLAMAVAHLLEIVGEAAKNVPAPVRDANPQIPWSDMARTRDRIIHGYMSIDYGVVWDIARNELPPLIRDLEALVGTEL